MAFAQRQGSDTGGMPVVCIRLLARDPTLRAGERAEETIGVGISHIIAYLAD